MEAAVDTEEAAVGDETRQVELESGVKTSPKVIQLKSRKNYKFELYEKDKI